MAEKRKHRISEKLVMAAAWRHRAARRINAARRRRARGNSNSENGDKYRSHINNRRGEMKAKASAKTAKRRKIAA